VNKKINPSLRKTDEVNFSLVPYSVNFNSCRDDGISKCEYVSMINHLIGDLILSQRNLPAGGVLIKYR